MRTTLLLLTLLLLPLAAEAQMKDSLIIRFKIGDSVKIPFEDISAIRFKTLTNAVRHTDERIPGTISYPNPSERTTTITFSLEKPQDVSIDITGLRGAMIKRVSARCESGPQEISWDGLLDNGESAPNGSYLYRLEADGKQLSGKLTIRR